jgi:flagellar M-ring protein FliF
MQSKWGRLDRRARTGIGAGLLLIVVLVGGLAWWAYRPDYQVLFADMGTRDAAAMMAELDKMKTPYQLAGGGTTIMVPRDLVYKTRLALMGKEVPLQGAVGFEVFNNADFGMTEFVQKVNYLRAVQGELTRTILSIEDIRNARVHLAIPEQGLFKKALAKPKASVTLTLKPGHVLAADQVAGIQRLVAASVPDIAAADVTVIDQHGVALTRPSSADTGGDSATGQLDSKRSTEEYLTKKVAKVLDRTFGAGEAIASVDVLLNLNQSKVTTEEVLPAHGAVSNGSPTGVMVRERISARDAEAAPGGAAGKAAGGISNSESDYQVGRRVEQLSVAAGTMRRMTVAVVVRQAMTEEQREKLREVVALAVGFNAERGDAIVVNSMDRLVTPAAPDPALADSAAAPVPAPASSARDAASVNVVIWVLAGLAALLAAGLLAWLFMPARRAPPQRQRLLTEAEREKMLIEVRAWIDTPASNLEKV